MPAQKPHQKPHLMPEVSEQDMVIAIMGPSGSGKSTFINYATRQSGQTVGHGLKSCTLDIRTVKATNPTNGRPVLFVDTPGFNNTYKSDNNILIMFDNWLEHIRKKHLKLAGILYLHRISDNRMAGTSLRDLKMIKRFDAMQNVILVSTMWSEIKEEVGARREQELIGDYWKRMLLEGSRSARFGDSFESAWNIIDTLDRRVKAVGETNSGITPYGSLRTLMNHIHKLFQQFNTQVFEPDMIIVVMGPTGSGKSTFINYATRQSGKTIGHGLKSYTSDIRTVRVAHPTSGRPVVLVDTPGFDDTYKKDTEIFAMVADWLAKSHKQHLKLAGILHFHRISDNRMAGTSLKNLKMFKGLCGDNAMQNVILVSTMWGEIQEEVGARREQELIGNYWKPMLLEGSRTARFGDSFESAWSIIDFLDHGEEEGWKPVASLKR